MIKIFRDRVMRIGLLKTIILTLSRLRFAIANIHDISLRRCLCCGGVSLFMRLGRTIDGVRCVRCGANGRYEMLAMIIRQMDQKFMKAQSIVEFDPNSPLRRILNRYGEIYMRTFYDEGVVLGSMCYGGAICQDIQRLTFQDKSVDIMISSDVMEHVPDFEQVICEVRRVLRDQGVYLFTVPMAEKTRQRARLVDDKIEYIMPPHYHLDPLDSNGALVFWEFGPDFVQYFKKYDLTLTCVHNDRFGCRVWCAKA